MIQTLKNIASSLTKENNSPIAVYTVGSINYVIYGATSAGAITGYLIKRIDSTITSIQGIDTGFLLESDRVGGANGSATNVNIKTDYDNTILLLTNPSLIYG
jgi:hypothetical protein